MNYLAHMLLTHHSASLTVGNFLGDMIRNSELDDVPQDIQTGVFLHRKIDSFTDNHPIVRNVIGLLRNRQGKYAPVAADVLFDHILANYWQAFCSIAYDDFCVLIYDHIRSRFEDIPERLQPRADRMIHYRWIEGYENREQFIGTLERLDIRSNFPSRFTELISQYILHKEEIDAHFFKFFPVLQEMTKDWISLQSAGK